MNIILLGAPGAGKGTQSEKLVAEKGFTQFSTGDAMRKQIKEGTALGKEVSTYIEKGALVPDETVNKIVGSYLETKHDGLIFDGYPRTIEQAKALDEMLSKLNSKIDKVVYLEASEEVVLKRISGRWICPVCKRSYHTETRPPKVAGICDYDGAKLVRRPDDEPATVKQRLATYKEQTEPLVDYYKKQGNLIAVDSNGDDSEAVNKEILKGLGLN